MNILNRIGDCVFILALAMTFSGCDDECDRDDKTTAEFRMFQPLKYNEVVNGSSVVKVKEVEEDTFMLGSQITFDALTENAESYEWTIGNDMRKFTEKTFSLKFNDAAVLSEIPLAIKLKIKKRASKCFPDDNGFDSLTQLLYIVTNRTLVGRYEGSDDTNSSHKYIIEISYGSRPGRVESYWISNLPDKCNSQEAVLSSVTAFEFAIGTYNIQPSESYECVFRDRDKHIGYLKEDRKTLVIEYEFTGKDETDQSKQKRVFTGVKIN